MSAPAIKDYAYMTLALCMGVSALPTLIWLIGTALGAK